MIRFGALLSAAIAASALAPAAALTQQPATIAGQVTDEGGNPLPAVQVFVQQLNIGASTGTDGRYRFVVPADRATGSGTLIARRIGFLQDTAVITLAPGAAITQNFTLRAAPTRLASVTVTALGLDRTGSELGTSVTRLSTEELNRTESQSVVNQIQGKVAGVQITGSGTQGGSQHIVIRGASSLTGTNTPLFVVDGIPISNTGRGGDPDGGLDLGSAINDLNPDDIETMTILKGPNAAAIYGSRAANGAVIITTKRARAGAIRTELNLSYTFDQPSILPDYQNLYGQGVSGTFEFVDGAGGGQAGSDGLDQSWGPRLDGRTHGCQWVDPDADVLVYDQNAPCSQFTAPGEATPWVAHPNNVKDFFQTGGTLSSTLAVSGGTDRVSARLSLGRDNVEGYIPNNTFTKTSALLSGQVRVTDRLNATGSLNYIRNVGENRPGVGYNTGILEQFIWFGRQVDGDALRRYAQGSEVNNGPPGREFNWNYNFHNNPYWLQHENPEQDTRDRFIGSLTATYDLTDWLSATARAGGDVYTYDIDRNYAAGNINYADPAYSGGFVLINDYSRTNNFDLFLQANRELLPGLTFQGLIGGSQLYRRFSSRSASTEGISAPGIYNVTNAAITPELDQNLERRRVNSLLGSAAVTWQNWLTVEATGRNDWSSTLPADNNSYFYPSLSTSVVLTEAIPALRGNPVLSFARVRGSIAQVGNDASPYSLATTYSGVSSQFGGLPQFTLSNVIANARLKPEITKASEVGLELGLFDGRASFDATYYTKSTRDQIFNIDVSPTTGFSARAINAGRMDNRGVEALLTLVPVRLDNSFEWTTSFNYAWNKNEVVELVEGLDAIDLG
ncbi:MAG TPA: SusC/RagA family TonB-linked outer membrane protein, partial [Gemmatimonadaceae bacterium]|nr:SusC/RagA family TonB-linked outer membrane protein [Gemmatimonadaceae bacterium]